MQEVRRKVTKHKSDLQRLKKCLPRTDRFFRHPAIGCGIGGAWGSGLHCGDRFRGCEGWLDHDSCIHQERKYNIFPHLVFFSFYDILNNSVMARRSRILILSLGSLMIHMSYGPGSQDLDSTRSDFCRKERERGRYQLQSIHGRIRNST